MTFDTLNVTYNQSITLENGAKLTVDGSGDSITTDGNNDLTGNDETINVLGTDVWITGSGDAITASGDWLDILNVDGPNDVLNGDSNTVVADNSSMVLDGSGDVVSGKDNAIILESDEDLTVNGEGDNIDATDDKITLAGDTSIVVQGDHDNFAVIDGTDQVIENRSDGSSVEYEWNANKVESETVYSGANNTGEIIGGAGYTGPGAGVEIPGGYGDYGGGYGFAVSPSLVSSVVGSNIGSIAQCDIDHGNTSAAEAAEAAQYQALEAATLVPTSGTGSAVLEGAKFDQQVITWSLADSRGTQAAPFSGYMDSTDEAVVQIAFNTWSAAMPGVTFEEVSDSAQSDIRLGFGDFNTATTGVVGYTSYQVDAGQMASDVIVRVEDTAQDALVTGADGQPVYSGSGVSLSQVVLHEIGHALGLADNADQSSVMNYQLTANNKKLDSTDLAGIGSLYGAGASTVSVGSSGVSQLIQAMSTFNADAGVADTALLPASLSTSSITLAASSHANPKILIFDEATSALDAESESIIHGNMHKICKDRTVFIIAHRLSAVRIAQRIITVERGAIVEEGSHDELLQQDGRYASLWRHQTGHHHVPA
jgi:predicted Zn-dependent protease